MTRKCEDGLTVRPVLFFAAQLLPEAQAAIAVRCHHFIAALRDAGLSVRVLSHSRAPEATRLLIPLPSNRLPVALRLLGETMAGVEIALRLALGALQGQRPLVVLSSPPYVSCSIAAIACRLLRIPYAWDARDLYPEVLENLGVLPKGGIVARGLRALMAYLYRRATFVSTPSDAFRRQVLAYGVADDRVHVVRNGYDEELFAVSAPCEEPEFVCINHGLLGRIHDIELLIAVAKRVESVAPRVRFRIIGHGPKESLLRGALPTNTEYLGPVAYDSIPAALSAADLGLAFITDGEGADGAFPVKVYECWGAGLPVLVTPLSEAGRLAGELGMGLAFSSGEVDALVTAIQRLSTRDDGYRALRAGVQRGRTRFGRRAESRRFAALVVAQSVASPESV